MKEYTVTTWGGLELTVLLDEDEAKARGAKPVQAPKPAAEPEASTKVAAPANKTRSVQAKA